MKPPQAAIAFTVIGFALGFGGPAALKHFSASGDAKEGDRSTARYTSSQGERASRPWLDPAVGQDRRLAAFVDRAASLTPEEWPGFFKTHAESPEWNRLAAQLWADQDASGFWKFLRQSGDQVALNRWAPDLLQAWTQQDPDAAMDAAVAITDKKTGDTLRRVVTETALNADLTKGLELTIRAGDFNHFSWGGNRPWIEQNPEAAVRGLAMLKTGDDYRNFLSDAVEAWVATDPKKALDWLVNESPNDRPQFGGGSFDWLSNGFNAAAKADPQAAMEAALAYQDPDERDRALSGVLESGAIAASDIPRLLAGCSPFIQSQSIQRILQSLPKNTAADFAAATQVLIQGPTGENSLEATKELANAYWKLDQNSDTAWDWADSLPDMAMRRAANEALASNLRSQQFEDLAKRASQLPISELSNQFFQNALTGKTQEEQEAWINQLPADRAAWARDAIQISEQRASNRIR